MNFFKKYYGLLIILILSFGAIGPFFINGFFPMHDDTQVARVYEMGKVLKQGIFPVRWVPDLGYGYGYPIFNFYAPLAYYFGSIFILLGFDALIATKIMMVIGIILSGLFMYLLAKEFFGKIGGIISGLFYLYAPYHAVQVYVRGDVAEFWAYAFIPLMFFGFYRLYKNLSVKINSQYAGTIGSIGFAGIILSHNLTSFMTAPFLIAVCLFLIFYSKKEDRIFLLKEFIVYIFLGLALSFFYWAPALFEMKNTNVLSQIGGGADFRNHFVCLNQLWDSPWGFGGSVGGCTDGLSFKIGKLHILLSVVILLITIFIRKIRKSKIGAVFAVTLLGLVVTTIFTLEMSRPIWELFYPMAFFQYPWRFLILISFFSSLLSGGIIFIFEQSNIRKILLFLALILMLLFANQKLFVSQTILPKTVVDYTNENTLKWTVSKISDEYLPINFKKPQNPNDVFRGKVDLLAKETNLERISSIISLIGLLVLAIDIIKARFKKNE